LALIQLNAEVLTAVDKEIFVSTVPVNVYEQMHVAALLRLPYHIFHRMDFGALLHTWILPLSV